MLVYLKYEFFPSAFNLDFYTEVQDLSYLLQHLDEDPFASRYKELNRALCGLIEDFSLVGFNTLCIEVSRKFKKFYSIFSIQTNLLVLILGQGFCYETCSCYR